MITCSIIKKSQLECLHRIDAEYFQPKYLKVEKDLLKTTHSCLFWKDIEGRFITGPFGSEFSVDNYTSKANYRYVRGKDVKEFFLLEDDNVYIPENDFNRLKKYSLREGDILISVVGTLGNVAIVDESIPPAIFSCKSTVFRTNAINTWYLLAYLNSKYGRSLLERNVRGAVQTGLNIDDLKTLHIYVPSNEKQKIISQIVLEAKRNIDTSKSLYSQAEDLLLEELGLKDFKIEDDLAYTVKLSVLKSARRADADYFQPKYKRIEDKLIRDFDAHKIMDMDFIKITTGQYCDEYTAEAEGKPYIRGTDLSQGTVNLDNLVYIAPGKQMPLKKAKEGDVVVTRVGTIGLCARLPKKVEGGTISDNLIRMRFPEEALNSFYVSLFFNTVGSQLMIRESRGSVQARLNQETLKEIILPILPRPTQQKIADLVRKSHEAHTKAKELLEKAKKEVERLIENQ